MRHLKVKLVALQGRIQEYAKGPGNWSVLKRGVFTRNVFPLFKKFWGSPAPLDPPLQKTQTLALSVMPAKVN